MARDTKILGGMIMGNGKKLKVTLDTVIPEGVVQISDFSVTYTQDADTNSSEDEYQSITVKALNNGLGGDGWYYDITTDTHWSINDADELADLINDFKARMNLNITKEKDIKAY